jgi:pyruvate dehydrogenase (quinone)
VIDAMVDPHEPPMPPMPPKVGVDQAAKLATSLARGTPDVLKIALTIAADRVREII